MKAWARVVDEHRLFLSVLTLAEYDKGIANLTDDDPNVRTLHRGSRRARGSFRRPNLVAQRLCRSPLGRHLRTGETRDRSSAARHRYLACGDGDRGGPVSGFSQHEGFAAQWSCSLRSMARRHRCVSTETASTQVTLHPQSRTFWIQPRAWFGAISRQPDGVKPRSAGAEEAVVKSAISARIGHYRTSMSL